MLAAVVAAAVVAGAWLTPRACRGEPQEERPAMDIAPDAPHLNPLTPEEARVILHKGTEAPFKGEYWDFFGEGAYTCRHCGALLYRSQDKFRTDCGWPAFDDAFPGAVRREPDADGRRTEILCANCGGHLGHVFEGEKLTPRDVRHCVNSLSLRFVPAGEVKLGTAIFAGGCFWGVEHYLQKIPGVLETTVGYTGGTTEKPTYEQVCAHTTGHVEAVQVTYDPARVSYETLAKTFFEIHDPTQGDGQGPDLGPQYHSVIFVQDDEQRTVVEKLVGILKAKGLQVVTRILPATTFWPAEEYHQDYYDRHGTEPYCHAYTKRF
jgi:peptide methionine sulfoxide reductase msrA/msrB